MLKMFVFFFSYLHGNILEHFDKMLVIYFYPSLFYIPNNSDNYFSPNNFKNATD